jgi:hypothetical protein
MRRRRKGEGPLLAAAIVVTFAHSAASITPAMATSSGSEKKRQHASASAAAPTDLSLEQRSGHASYGSKVVVTAKLTSAGKPLAGRQISFTSGSNPLGAAVTDRRGAARFELAATGSQTIQASFAPATPQDAATFQPATSKPLATIVSPVVKVMVSSPLRAGRKAVGVPGVKLRIRGRVVPFRSGAQVSVRAMRRGRTIKRSSEALTESGRAGRFSIALKLRRPGRYVVRTSLAASGELGAGRSRAKRLLIVRPHAGPGSSGAKVRALQGRLKALGYVTSVSGRFDGSTGRAVLAFRKVFGMQRVSVASRAVFRRLAKGGGRFRVRYPKAGRHVEFDWSRQILVLAQGSRPVKVVHASSGKPSTPTVFGHFHFYSKTPGYNAKGMYYSNYFVGGYAIHGYADVPTFAASHGCIRIPIPTAIAVYRWIQLGNDIFVYR